MEFRRVLFRSNRGVRFSADWAVQKPDNIGQPNPLKNEPDDSGNHQHNREVLDEIVSAHEISFSDAVSIQDSSARKARNRISRWSALKARCCQARFIAVFHLLTRFKASA